MIKNVLLAFFGVSSNKRFKNTDKFVEKYGVKYFLIIGFSLILIIIFLLISLVNFIIRNN